MSETIGKRLIGTADERAVSPVIAVILMVAMTVTIAIVIGAFVLDLDERYDEEARAGVNIEVSDATNEIEVEVISLGNADYVTIVGDVRDEDADSSDEIYFADNNTDAGWGEAEALLSELEVSDSVTIGSAADDDADVLMGDNAVDDGTITVIGIIEDSETRIRSKDYDLDWEDDQ